MPPYKTPPGSVPLTPEGCIAAIPAQSAQSCELVITALAHELAYVRSVLGEVLEVYILGCNASDEEREGKPVTPEIKKAQHLLGLRFWGGRKSSRVGLASKGRLHLPFDVAHSGMF